MLSKISNLSILAEDEVNPKKVMELCQQAFIDVKFTNDALLVIEINKLHCILEVDENRKFIKLAALFQFKNSAGLVAKNKLIETINSDYILVRAHMLDDDNDTLIVEYFLLYIVQSSKTQPNPKQIKE
ncbi:hypothetical protein [Suttonella ornithocola]|uniref:Uncharacterized protein n=1 Tax=Suttonella ornithocola TaxID=279832 RepID=A0A380MZM2_9GAMM|nr:hypothetical protein [Suttonella ornithocola]SUO97323.1 Uncharacterised protein [Suttonella ornithocola]